MIDNDGHELAAFALDCLRIWDSQPALRSEFLGSFGIFFSYAESQASEKGYVVALKSLVDDMPSSSGITNKEKATSQAIETAKRCWKNDQDLRREFCGCFDAYVKYIKATTEGRSRVFKGGS